MTCSMFEGCRLTHLWAWRRVTSRRFKRLDCPGFLLFTAIIIRPPSDFPTMRDSLLRPYSNGLV